MLIFYRDIIIKCTCQAIAAEQRNTCAVQQPNSRASLNCETLHWDTALRHCTVPWAAFLQTHLQCGGFLSEVAVVPWGTEVFCFCHTRSLPVACRTFKGGIQHYAVKSFKPYGGLRKISSGLLHFFPAVSLHSHSNQFLSPRAPFAFT